MSAQWRKVDARRREVDAQRRAAAAILARRRWPALSFELPAIATISAMPKTKDSPQTRRAIAARAARLMAEDALSEFGAAKRKAARQLGFADNQALPSNEEVEAELRSYQLLFQNDEQRERLGELRAIALELMETLSAHQPCLTGAVWNGTAGRDTGVHIDLFTDAAKTVEMKLLSNGTAYRVEERAHFNRALARKVLALTFLHDDTPVQLNLYTSDDYRGALIADATGAAARGGIDAVKELVAQARSSATVDAFLAALR